MILRHTKMLILNRFINLYMTLATSHHGLHTTSKHDDIIFNTNKNMSLNVGQIYQISALIDLYWHQIDKLWTF